MDHERRSGKMELFTGIGLLAAFAVWTMLIQLVDVQGAGPDGTMIGFAEFNVFICLCFAMLGLIQLIRRKSLFKVDWDIILLGIYYVLVIFGYLFFEMVPVNYRPILIEGRLESSYPSSTTLLVVSVMPTLQFQMDRRAENPLIKRVSAVVVIAFSAFMVIGRMIAGVHWATDIIGSILLSAGLFSLYRTAVIFADGKRAKQHPEEFVNGVQ